MFRRKVNIFAFYFEIEKLPTREIFCPSFFLRESFFVNQLRFNCLHTLNYASPTPTASERKRDSSRNRWKSALSLHGMNERSEKNIFMALIAIRFMIFSLWIGRVEAMKVSRKGGFPVFCSAFPEIFISVNTPINLSPSTWLQNTKVKSTESEAIFNPS